MVYASACLPDKTQPVLLQLEDRKKQWHAMLSVSSRNQRRLHNGWKEFAEENQLKVRDICLFEVSSRNSTSLTMTVHLVRSVGSGAVALSHAMDPLSVVL
jgi:hypothetical protein